MVVWRLCYGCVTPGESDGRANDVAAQWVISSLDKSGTTKNLAVAEPDTPYR